MPYPDETLLDFERMRELREIVCEDPTAELPQEINDLYRIYLRSGADTITQAKTALLADDIDTGGRLIHSLKGAAANAGTPKVQELAFQLEQMLKKKQGSRDEHLARLKEIQSAFEETREAIVRCYKVQAP